MRETGSINLLLRTLETVFSLHQLNVGRLCSTRVVAGGRNMRNDETKGNKISPSEIKSVWLINTKKRLQLSYTPLKSLRTSKI